MDETKLGRLDDLLAERDLASVWFARPGSFAWLTGGDNRVDESASVGVAAAGYDGERVRVVTSNTEADRLADEELPDEVAVTSYPWHESTLAAAVAEAAATPAAADVDVPGFETVDPTPLRQPLTDIDVERYRDLGETVAGIVEERCRAVAATDTERSVAADLRRDLAAAGIDAPVVRVGGSERVDEYAHCRPTDHQLGDHARLTVTGHRDGLHASCTRTVAFRDPSELQALVDAQERAMLVDATAIAATQVVAGLSGAASGVVQNALAAYEIADHPDAWRDRDLGGATGYATREWLATPDSDAAIELPMAFAWNPTVGDARSCDTVLVREDDIEPLTATDDWPMAAVKPHDFEVVVDRPDILYRS